MHRLAKSSDEDFIRAWQAASSVSDVAKLLNVTFTAASNRANRMRKRGIPLRSFVKAADRIDLPSLIALAKSLAPSPVEGNGQHDI